MYILFLLGVLAFFIFFKKKYIKRRRQERKIKLILGFIEISVEATKREGNLVRNI